jgi:hypothetical protein
MPSSGTKKPITPTINSSRQMKPAFLLGAFIAVPFPPEAARRRLRTEIKEAADPIRCLVP